MCNCGGGAVYSIDSTPAVGVVRRTRAVLLYKAFQYQGAPAARCSVSLSVIQRQSLVRQSELSASETIAISISPIFIKRTVLNDACSCEQTSRKTGETEHLRRTVIWFTSAYAKILYDV